MSNKTSKIDRSAVFQAILGDLDDAPQVPENIAQSESTSTSPEGAHQRFEDVLLDLIDFDPDQPRSHFSEHSLTELARSIQQHGVLEPILIRARGDRFTVIAGERRTRAAKIAGFERIPAQILDVTDTEAFELSIIENLQREDLNPVEETDGIVRLLASLLDVTTEHAITLLQDAYNRARGRKAAVASPDQLAIITEVFDRIGRFSITSFVSNRVPILSFPTAVKNAVRSGDIEFTKAQLLARINDLHIRDALLEATIRENLSLSQLRRRIAEAQSDQQNIGLKQDGIFSSSKEAGALLRQVRSQLSMRAVVKMSGQKQAELARLLSQLNHFLQEN